MTSVVARALEMQIAELAKRADAQSRRAARLLKRYFTRPTIPNAMAFDTAAEAHQIAVGRLEATRIAAERVSQ